MLLLIKSSCPQLSSNRRSCSKSVSSKLRSRASPHVPFRPTGHRLAERNLGSSNTFWTHSKVEMRTFMSQVNALKQKTGWCCLRWGRKGEDSNPGPRISKREEKAVKEFCFHFEITELRREREERQRWSAGCPQQAVDMQSLCICPLGSVIHTSPWLN